MTAPHEPVRALRAHGLMVLTTLLVASSFPVGAAIAGTLPSGVLMCVRFLLAALLLGPYVVLKHGRGMPPPGQLLRYGVLSVPLSVFFWCMFEALQDTSAVHAGALNTLVPAFAAVYARWINRTRTSRRRWIGLLIGTVGALWIVFEGDWRALLALQFNRGDVVFLIGCLFLAVYYPLVERFQRGEPTEVMTFWVMLFSAVLLFLVSLNRWPQVDWNGLAAGVYAGVVYLAIFTTLVTFFLLQRCVVILGTTRAAAYGFLTPLMVVAIAAALGMERIQPRTFPGMALVVLAMVCIQSDAEPAGPSSGPPSGPARPAPGNRRSGS